MIHSWLNRQTQNPWTQRSGSTDMCHHIDEPWKHYEKRKKWDGRAIYCVILFIWNVLSTQTQRDTGESWFPGSGEKKNSSDRWWGQNFFCGVMKRLWSQCWWLHNLVSILKPTKWYTFWRSFSFGFKFLFIWLCWVLAGIFVSSCGIFLMLCTNYLLHGLQSTCRCNTRAWLLHSMRDLVSPTRDQTHVPCTARHTHYHWTTREVLWKGIL